MFIRELRRQVSFFFRRVRNMYLRRMGVSIGHNVFISYGAWVDIQDGNVILEDGVRITKGCKILSHDHTAWKLRDGKGVNGRTIIKKNAFLGMNVIVLPGVTIGEGSIVGAGCVIAKDVPSYSVIVGARPRIIKQKNLETGTWESL